MKALPKKLLSLTVFAIAVTSLFCARPAEALHRKAKGSRGKCRGERKRGH